VVRSVTVQLQDMVSSTLSRTRMAATVCRLYQACYQCVEGYSIPAASHLVVLIEGNDPPLGQCWLCPAHSGMALRFSEQQTYCLAFCVSKMTC
jgi:hypothetical protein